MKNKKMVVLSIMIVVVLFAGVSYSSGINGMFEGFSIVNVFVNGEKMESDVPAINFNGRTMVPVRFVSEELGAEVSWDGNTASAYITTINTGSDADESSQLNKEIREHYSKLKEYGAWLALADNVVNLELANYLENGEHSNVNVSEGMNFYLEGYNSMVDPTNELVEKAGAQGIDITNMYTIMNHYSTSLDYYYTLAESATEYTSTGDEEILSYVLENSVYASIDIMDALEIISNHEGKY